MLTVAVLITACPETPGNCVLWAEQHVPGFRETQSGDLEHTPVIDCHGSSGACSVTSWSAQDQRWKTYRCP